ncbi:MAG: sigma-54 dependent transcriptional regulator [Phycisphaerae bacterium]
MDGGGDRYSRLAVGSPQVASHNGLTLVGTSQLFRNVLKVVDSVATNDCVVLLEGESGTGKELLARRIHVRSRRCEFPFIPVNCAAISDTLFESQFYGHVKGAFTGAATSTLGVVRAADGGTLLLDEVAEMPVHLQPKLLRLLQESEVTPVGAARPISVDARFIASTNRQLLQRVAEGSFRSDLYHRLNIVRIEVPPLRSRPDDVEPLLDYYLDHYARQYHRPRRQLGSRLRACLREYPWPGNVRELCAYVERLYAAGLPPMPPQLGTFDEARAAFFSRPVHTQPDRMPVDQSTPVGCSLAEVEKQAIRNALELTGYNRSAAARILAIHRSTLLRKIRYHGIDAGSRRPFA